MRQSQYGGVHRPNTLNRTQDFEGTRYSVGQSIPPYGTILAFYTTANGTMVRFLSRNILLSIVHKFKEGAK